MKNFYLTLSLLVFTGIISAQNFEYSLSLLGTNATTGNYEVALMATPDFDETDGNSADIGTVVSMSTNVYVQTSGFVNNCVNSGPPLFEDVCDYPIEKEEWSANYLTAPSTASGRTVFSLERTETGESTFFDAINGTPVILAVFQIYNTGAGLPTTGDITLVDNGDTILNGTPNGSYLNIKYTMATGNITTDLYGTLSTTSNSINFATLSNTETELTNVSVYPNPVKDTLYIKGLDTELTKVEVYNLNGQKIITKDSNLTSLDLSTLNTGIYFTKLYTSNGSKTIKLIKE